MSLDLRLLPFDHDGGTFAFSHTILRMGNARDMYDALKDANVPQMEVPKDFNSFTGRRDGIDDLCYGPTTKTPYGEPLMFTTVKHLIELPADVWQWDKPTFAYLKELKPETKVALYWH